MSGVISKTYPVMGMTCAGCSASVESMLNAQKGVLKASVNLTEQNTFVKFDPQQIKPEKMKEVIQSIGYDLIIDEVISDEEIEKERKENFKKLLYKTVIAFILSFPVFIMGMFFHKDIPNYDIISMFLAGPVVFWLGWQFFRNAYKQALHGKANMDTLVALSTGIAFAFSAFNTIFPQVLQRNGIHPEVYFEAAAVIISFILLGRTLEERAKSNTSTAIKKLLGLQAKTVRVIRNEEELEIKIEDIQIGEKFILRPGEKIPVDGKVLSGHSYVNESMVSGESMPIEKIEGAQLFAGTINQNGTLTAQAEKIGSDTLLSQIIKTVREAQASKAPVQKLADKIAGIFVPIILIISILTFAVWFIAGGEQHLLQGIIASITVLVIACPCALGLATPTALIAGIGKGSENGILIKDAESLEIAHKVNTIVLDKTGTITKGTPQVTNIIWSEYVSNQDHLKQILFTAEKHSEHPIAQTIAEQLRNENVKTLEHQEFENIAGSGVRLKIDGENYFVGTLKHFEGDKSSGLFQDASNLKTEAKTVVYFYNSNALLAIIAIADNIKENSAEAIKLLKEKNISVSIISGDNYETTKAIAEQVNVKDFKAEVLPSDKGFYIDKLQSEGRIVAMVGDGINDSEALAKANLGIAMAKGSDLAMDVAHITLMNSDLKYINAALKLSSATVRTIRQNLFWAFIYNIIGIPIAAGILFPINGFLLNPMIAGAAMAMSSVSVVTNSLRLKSIKLFN